MNLDSPIGVQKPCSWTAGEGGVKTLCTLNPPVHYNGYLDVTVVGRNVIVNVTYGSSASLRLSVGAPMRASFKGSVSIECEPVDPGLPAFAKVAVVTARSAGPTSVHLETGTGPMPVGAVRLTALNAVTGTMLGVPFALVAGQTLPCMDPCVIASGNVVWEFTV